MIIIFIVLSIRKPMPYVFTSEYERYSGSTVQNKMSPLGVCSYGISLEQMAVSAEKRGPSTLLLAELLIPTT